MRINFTTKFGVYVFCIITSNFTTAYNAFEENTLIEHLFSGYLKYVIPRENSNIPLNVSINPFFLLLDKVDVKRQTFTARIYFELTWLDNLLKWDPENHSGIEKIHIPYNMIWTPDICIAGDLGDYTDIGKGGTTAVIHNTGYVVFWPIKMFEITCVVQIQNYPFDEHTCEIDLSSWTFDDEFIQLVAGNDSINIDMLTSSGEWFVKKEFAYYSTAKHGLLGYSHVIFPFRLQRRWQFIILNMFFPTSCTSLLSLLCFCLPNESGERVGLSISIFLTLAVFMTVTSGDLPETANEVSLLGAYVALQLVWSGITIVLTVTSLVIAHKDKHQNIPIWLQALTKSKINRTDANGLKESFDDSAKMQTECDCVNQDAVPEGLSQVYPYSAWNDVAKRFNTLCFYGSFMCQFGLNLWFLIRAVLY